MSRWRLFYHLVWTTRDRQPFITPEWEARVHARLREAAERHGIMVHAVGGTDDHVHLAVSIPPTLPVATAIQRIKGASSRMINEEFGDGFGWQAEYSVDSFAERHLPRVVSYIVDQRRHHAEGTLWPAIEELPGPQILNASGGHR
ncbi:IS200/IS605 family transposase [Sphaerobacter sp.]|uniref:IS200/IS605 family transposase n=1 Tax=Sphaerobacter sp. TaxID=2099654 RepID=UPI001DD15B13|nr:IS200/IS605 family transposase [Sphaerobacter sp.]MBX5445599.1 IS200/IS605 family transposase [Sphaerobacter sp.]